VLPARVVVLGCSPAAINPYGVMQLQSVPQVRTAEWQPTRPLQYANYVGRDQ
jgi:hypothetical protein